MGGSLSESRQDLERAAGAPAREQRFPANITGSAGIPFNILRTRTESDFSGGQARTPQVVARSPDRAMGPTEGLPSGARETFGRAAGGVRRPRPSAVCLD